MRGTFHVLELPALDRPEKNVGDDRDEDEAERDQKIEDVHGSEDAAVYGWMVHLDFSHRMAAMVESGNTWG